MFTKDEMLIPVQLVEERVGKLKEKHKAEIENVSVGYTKIINDMKGMASISFKGKATIRNAEFKMGESTPFYSKGIKLFTGDEVEFKSGRRGIVVKRIFPADIVSYDIFTNKGAAQLVDEEYLAKMKMHFASFEGYVTGDSLNIIKHFNTLVNGEEVARGRKGAEGFKIRIED